LNVDECFCHHLILQLPRLSLFRGTPEFMAPSRTELSPGIIHQDVQGQERLAGFGSTDKDLFDVLASGHIRQAAGSN
jgi:hypothetical protein